jgi:hypothetical protein
VLSAMLMLRTKIQCPPYHSYLLSLLYLSFSEYRQLWSPWRHSPCPFESVMWYIFEKYGTVSTEGHIQSCD